MKRIRITLLVTFVALALTLIQAGTSTAYQLGWTAIQHRVYESGATINRLAFEILDDSGNYVAQRTWLLAILTSGDPNGNPVNLTTLNFSPLLDYYGA